MNKERLITIVKILGVAACLYLFIVGIRGMGAAFKIVNNQEPTRIVILINGDETLAEKAIDSLSNEQDQNGKHLLKDLEKS